MRKKSRRALPAGTAEAIPARRVKVEWIAAEKGGRKAIFSGNRYWPVSKFPEDFQEGGTWSIFFNFDSHAVEDGKNVSFGEVHFLVQNAPHEWMDNYDTFDIYEGARKVAAGFLAHL